MKLKITLGILATIVISAFVYFSSPQRLYETVMAIEKMQAKLTEKTITAGDSTWSYLEGGTGDVILLLHGFNSHKETWNKFAGHLTDSYRVIIPDIPGFGKSSYDENKMYTIKDQARRMMNFLKALKIKKVHVAGNSMGGAIAARMTILWPDIIKTLTLFDSGGVVSPEKSDLRKLIDKGDNPLVVKKTADYKRLVGFNFVKSPWLPDSVAKWMGEENKKRAGRNNVIFSHISKDMLKIEKDLNKINQPSLVIWGKNDRIIHVSSAQIFHKKIKGSKLYIIDQCGHMPQLEKAKEVSVIFKNFLNDKIK